MKTLYLLRHGTAGWDTSDDIKRRLNAQGLAEAQNVAQWLVEKGHQPELIHCSAALRTRQTASAVLQLFPETPLHLFPELYLAGRVALFNHVERLPDEKNHVLLIGHNPGLSQFANDVSDCAYICLQPAEIRVITFETDRWIEMSAGLGKLTDGKF